MSCSVTEKLKKATENKPKALQKLPKVCFKVNISGVVVICLMCAIQCRKSCAAVAKERRDPPLSRPSALRQNPSCRQKDNSQ